MSPGNGVQIFPPKSVRPSPELAEYVRAYQYWETFTGRGAHPFAVSVLPLLTFYLGARCPAFEYVGGRTRLLPAVIALGPCDHRVADVMPIGHQKNFTVLFEPTGFYRLFRISPAEVRNHAYDCSDVLGRHILDLHAKLCAAKTFEQMIGAVEDVLLNKTATALPRSQIQQGARQILRSKGRSDLAAMSSRLGLSESSWRRHFITEVGVTPKRYVRMLRFQHAVALKRGNPTRAWTDVGLEAGYYDQAHLIADFHGITRANPSQFMRELGAVPHPLAGFAYDAVGDGPERAGPRATAARHRSICRISGSISTAARESGQPTMYD
jgi:AraC-like DNA-binding protein